MIIMADIQKVKKSKEYKNYKSVDAALSCVGQSLEQFTVQSIATVHQKISQTLAGLPLCNHQCSTIPNQKRWCQTCSSWKQELMNFLRNRREVLKWDQLKSWEWPLSPDHIRNVFLPADWKMKDINFKDLSTMINVWKRCTEVNRRIVNAIDPIRKLRNEFEHKYSDLQIEDNDMQNKFYTIFNVLNRPELNAIIPAYNDLVDTLRDIEQYGMDTNVEKALTDIQSTLQDVLKEGKESRKQRKEIQMKNEEGKVLVVKVLFVLVIPTLATAVFMSPCFFTASDEIIPVPSTIDDIVNGSAIEGCLLEEPHPLFRHRYVRLVDHFSHYKTFVGRKWLFERLEERLEDNNTDHGVMMIAEIGYGKTAIVANIVCAAKSDSSYNLKIRVIAYYMCRFDLDITKRQFVFIKRLTSMIAMKIPKFLELLQYKYTSCIDIFDADTCDTDPVGCLDYCLILPLKHLPGPKGKPKIVLIDALDECENSRKETTKNVVNGIALLLKYKMHLFPKWLKFVLTCRNDWYCRQLKSNLHLESLHSNDTRNVNDIKAYASLKGNNDVNKIINLDMPNFLWVAVHLSSDNVTTDKVQPLTVPFEHQFTRYFSDRYEKVKPILEIICSSFKPMSEAVLWYIVSNTTDTTPDEYEVSFRKLSIFLLHIGNDIHIFHVSLKEWLLDKDNVIFKINLSTGHYLHALYLLELFKDTRNEIDVVVLVSHAALANTYMNVKVLEKVASLNTNDLIAMDSNKKEYPLHRMARHYDYAPAAKLLLRHFPETDKLNQQSLTPLFIAASSGNVEVFETLIYAGANVNFRTKSMDVFINDTNLREHFSHSSIYRYGMLDIAAQNGHHKIVKSIFEHNEKIFDYPLEKRNGYKLLPIHLSCKNGHTMIVNYTYTLHPWMLDDLCLSFAAEGGHNTLVDFLLNVNITDDCKQINYTGYLQARQKCKDNDFCKLYSSIP